MPDAKKLQLWNFHTGELIGSLLPAVSEVIFSDASPNSQIVAAVQDMSTVLYDVDSRQPRASSVDERIRGHVRFHPGGELLAASSETGAVLLDAHTLKVVRELDFGMERPNVVAFSPDGLTCAVGGSNKQFAVFDVDL